MPEQNNPNQNQILPATVIHAGSPPKTLEQKADQVVNQDKEPVPLLENDDNSSNFVMIAGFVICAVVIIGAIIYGVYSTLSTAEQTPQETIIIDKNTNQVISPGY